MEILSILLQNLGIGDQIDKFTGSELQQIFRGLMVIFIVFAVISAVAAILFSDGQNGETIKKWGFRILVVCILLGSISALLGYVRSISF
jgi:hypothetical protein